MYRAGIEGLLGLTRVGQKLRLNPCFPKAWPEMSATVTLGDAKFAISVLNPENSGYGIASAQLNGVPVQVDNGGLTVPLTTGTHDLTVVLGKVPVDVPHLVSIPADT